MGRLGAEHRQPGRDHEQWALRQAFVRTVERLLPDVVTTLLDTPLQAYRDAAADGAVPQGWRALGRAAGRSAQAKKLRVAISKWGRQYHFTTPGWGFMHDVALRTLWEQHEWEQGTVERLLDWAMRYHSRWLLEMASENKRCLTTARRIFQPNAPIGSNPPIRPPFSPLELFSFTPRATGFAAVPFADIAQVAPPFRFKHRGWLSQYQTWEEYEVELQTKLREVIRAHQKARRAEARKLGLEPTPRRRELDKHLTWLVLFQVEEWDCGRIGLRYNAGSATVNETIKKLAGEIGLTLRRGKPGRPLGRRNRRSRRPSE